MTSTPTGDIETIRLLDQAVKRHRGDAEAWQRLGAQLAARRTQLGYPHGKREQFVRERGRPPSDGGLRSKYVYEMEHGITGPRKGWPTGRLLAAIDLYAVTPQSVIAALDGEGDLEPVPAARPAPVLTLAANPAPAPPAADPPVAVLRSGVLTDAGIKEAVPHVTEILIALRDLALASIVRPTGRQLFPDDDWDAQTWDKFADDMSDVELAWLIAGRRVLESSARRDRSVV